MEKFRKLFKGEKPDIVSQNPEKQSTKFNINLMFKIMRKKK